MTALGVRGARHRIAPATLAFVATAGLVLALGGGKGAQEAASPLVGDVALLPMLLALPLGMALATGVEAPSNAIAQLGGGVFAAFQAGSAALLLAAASAFLAGSGLLEALANHRDGENAGPLPARFRMTNRWYVPIWGIAALAGLSAALVSATGGHEQELVHYYAVAVFASFLGALVAASVLAWRDGNLRSAAVAATGALCVLLILVLNLRRADPVVSLGASAAVSLLLWRTWVARGRPGGVGRIAS